MKCNQIMNNEIVASLWAENCDSKLVIGFQGPNGP